MKNAFAALSVAGLIGASGFVAWSVFSRPEGVAPESASAFDLKETPAPEHLAPRPAGEALKDAVAAPSSPRPISIEGMVVPGAASAAARPAVRPFLTPALEAGARKSRLLTALLRAPARFLIAATPLKSARGFGAFLGDKAAVNAYLDSPLVRAALNSPAVAKSVLGSPELVRAFLGSPAMRDPGTIKALLGSRMLVKILDCPGVQEALADPAVIRSIATDPGTLQWIVRNPQALTAIASAAPGLANSLGAAPR
jgi:hypothetical protein